MSRKMGRRKSRSPCPDIVVDPQKYLNQLFNYAVDAYKKADYPIAESTFHQILRDFPNNPDALHLLGVTLGQQKKNDKALEYIKKAIRANPKNPVYHNNIGRLYLNLKQYEEAAAHFDKAVLIDPMFVEAYYNLSNLKKAQGDLKVSEEYLNKTTDIDPKHFNAWYNLGNLHMGQGNYKTAIGHYEKALSLKGDFVQAHNNLGIVLQEWDRWDEAINHFKQAIQFNPQFSEGHRNLAQAFERQGRIKEARESYEIISQLQPEKVWNRFHAQTMAPVIFQSNEEIDQYRQNLHQVLDHYLENPLPLELDQMSENGVEPPSNLIYQGRDDKELKQKFAQLFGPIFSPRELKIKKGPRHIGFVVTGGHEGVFIKCMRGIIDQLSRDKFQVSVVCSLPNGEKIIRPAFSNDQTQFLSLPKDLEQAAKMMLNANFDILHYWEVGTDSSNYFLPYFRLAPVQCSSWGWPVTSGILQMDYFI